MPLLNDTTLGIDFGTSNSAMAVRQGTGPARMVALEGQAHTLPTALFFNAEDHRTHFGRDAVSHYLAGTEGRLMRSLKSLLGSALLQDKTAVHNRMVSYQDIISVFLRMLAQKAHDGLGGMPARVVMGRPVHFVDGDADRDRQAEDALRQAALDAGFSEVSFQLEPIAAALDYEQRIAHESLVLVVDIGGGTSDFTVVRLGPDRRARAERGSDVLATTGVHVGGTDFDRRLSLDLLMPLLGFRHIGPTGREVPSRVFFDPVAVLAARAARCAKPAHRLFGRPPARTAHAGVAGTPGPPAGEYGGARQDCRITGRCRGTHAPGLGGARAGGRRHPRGTGAVSAAAAGAGGGLRAGMREAGGAGCARPGCRVPHWRVVGAAAFAPRAAGCFSPHPAGGGRSVWRSSRRVGGVGAIRIYP
jgi:hypothetical protein